MTESVAVGTLREEPTRFVPYLNWAVAQDLGPWKLVELDGPWPVTVTYMRAPAGEMMRPREIFHDLFISMRTVELWEKSIGRRRRFIFRRGTIGFTCAGSVWHLGWSGVLEGVGFLFSDETLHRAFGKDAHDMRWRLALSDHAPAIGFLGIEIANQVFGGFPEGREHVDQLIGSFLALAARRYSAAPEKDALKLGRHHPQVQRAVRFIEENLATQFAVDDVCRAADISVAHINRNFQAELGTSVWQYVKMRRLEKAQGLLSETSMTIAEIATACGFGATAHFTNAFRARYGFPPKSARSRITH